MMLIVLVATESVGTSTYLTVAAYDQPATRHTHSLAGPCVHLRPSHSRLDIPYPRFLSCSISCASLSSLCPLSYTSISPSALLNHAVGCSRVAVANSQTHLLESYSISSDVRHLLHPPPSKVAICFASSAKKGWPEAVWE
jgi:hypothetical protein